MFNIANTEVPVKGAAATVPKKTNVERERMAAWLAERVKASKSKPSAEVVTLTPVLAELLLETNSNNRPISEGNETSLISDLANDRFEFNGESIVVSSAGTLIDGQHRCQMVVKSRKSIQTVIAFGPREEARFTIDIGRPKSAANFLAMQGHKYSATLASAARMILLNRSHGSLVSGGATSGRNGPTKTEVMAAVGQLRGLDASVDFVSSAPKSLGGKSVLAFTHYLITKKSTREAADFFFGKLIEGENLRRGDPILYCRNRLPELNTTGGGIGSNARAELILKCWNYHRLGATDVSKIPLNGRLPKVER
jgi:hypothetical protein